jgi:predicted amidohydrolase YtcJ
MKVQGFKAYFDGSLGSRTAWMSQPYRNNPPEQPNWSGLPMPIVTDGAFLRNARAAAASGYQIIVHAIGDEANRTLAKQLLEVYGGAEALRRARPRSEHAQHLAPDVVMDFGRLGILASMQPYHKADDGRYAETYLGRERCGWSYAYRKLLNAGAVLAFGSDWPVVTQNVFLGMEAAVDARILNGMIWFPEERIPVTEAVRGYTTSAAFACFMENEIGRIAPGYRADFQILNETIFANEVRWNEVRPTAVFVEGKRVL